MNKGVPSGPLTWTVVAVALVNILAGYALAHIVSPARAPMVPLALVAVMALCALVSAVLAVRGWREHYRRRRMVS